MKYFTLMIIYIFLFQTDAAEPTKKNGKNFFKNTKTSIKNPFELRDPFKKPRLRIGKRNKTYGGLLQDNSYSNLASIEGYKVDQIRVVGVLLGKQRKAIAKVATTGDTLSTESFILVEGMKIGENDAEVKAIVPGGVVLVERIINVYDQEEYIETIIPVSTELN